MKAKWKPIINIHQSLKWILDVYRVLGTYACLTVSRLYMWEILDILSNACQTRTFPHLYWSLTNVLPWEKRETPEAVERQTNKGKWYPYAGCRLSHWSPCRWELLCWKPCRWSAGPSRWWKEIGRACSRCFLSYLPGAKSAKSEKGLNKKWVQTGV